MNQYNNTGNVVTGNDNMVSANNTGSININEGITHKEMPYKGG